MTAVLEQLERVATSDAGDVKFSADLRAGVVKIGIRPPLALETGRVTVDFGLLEFLDIAARLTLSINDQQRRLTSQLRQFGQ